MTLTFDPLEPYVKMVMEMSDEKLTQFFESMGIDINLTEDDEGFIYDCEG